MIHDAYRDCENPVPDYALLNNHQPTSALSGGQRLGGGGSSTTSSGTRRHQQPASIARNIVQNVPRSSSSTAAPRSAAAASVQRLPAVRSNSIPSNNTTTTTTAGSVVRSSRPILHTTTVVRVLPGPSTTRLIPVPNRPQQQQQRAIAAVIRPMPSTRSATTAPDAQQSVTRNIGSIFARTMIQMKTTVYKWRRATNAEADANCAICLEQFLVDVLVR